MTDDRDALSEEVRATWNVNAPFWDARLSRPDSWQQTLVFPAIERLLELLPGETVLEIACGSGLLAERMLAAGARVVAFDFSEAMVERARARAPKADVRVIDATDEAALLRLVRGIAAGLAAGVAGLLLINFGGFLLDAGFHDFGWTFYLNLVGTALALVGGLVAIFTGRTRA
jgi:SAM-dependent methyltransferase